MASSTPEIIDEFLSLKRIAMVGLSRNPNDFTRSVYREFVQRGYDIVPVNPGASEIDGRRCFAHVAEISPPVEGALLFTRGPATDQTLEECASTGVERVWLHRGVGAGAMTPNAVPFCNKRSIKVVAGECPLMFLPGAGLVHRVHRFFRHGP